MSDVVATSQQGLTDKYHPYPEYKDSGVEWYRSIPADWGVERLKFSVRKLESGTSVNAMDTPAGLGQVGVLKTSAVYTGEFRRSENKAVLESDLARVSCPVKNGCLVVSRMNTPDLVGAAGLVTEDAESIYLPDRLWQVHVTDGAAKFIHYWTLTPEYRNQVRLVCTGTSSSMQNLSQEQFLNFLIPALGEDEKNSIAAFLDYETARIDRLIAQQQRLIELLKEKRQALISHAVRTRPGEGHIKLAYAINLLTGYPFASSGFKSAKDTHIPLLRGANVGVDQIKWDDVVYWDSEDCSHLDDYHLECGDIVFGMDRPWISSGARVAEITQHDTPCLLLQRVARIRAKANHFQTYIKLCLSSNEFRNYVEADLTGVSVPHISPDQIKGFLIRNLPYDEQVSVTKEVLQALEKLNAVESAVFNAIELLQERRTALISAAVTGKIDLRYWTRPAEEAAS